MPLFRTIIDPKHPDIPHHEVISLPKELNPKEFNWDPMHPKQNFMAAFTSSKNRRLSNEETEHLAEWVARELSGPYFIRTIQFADRTVTQIFLFHPQDFDVCHEHFSAGSWEFNTEAFAHNAEALQRRIDRGYAYTHPDMLLLVRLLAEEITQNHTHASPNRVRELITQNWRRRVSAEAVMK